MGKSITAVDIIDVQRRRNPSKYYVYVIAVTWSDGSVITIYRRYSQFFELHVTLLDKFPIEAGIDPIVSERTLPFLPGKKLFGRSHTHRVAQSRAKPLEEYLKSLILQPKKITKCSWVLEFFDATSTDIKPPSEEERERKPKPLLKKILSTDSPSTNDKEINIGDVMSLDQYRAVANYKSQAKNELTFATGDLFEVVEKNDNGWWFVSKDVDTQGWVPATYLEPLEDPEHEEQHSAPIPADDEKYITICEYVANHPDEIGYEKGVIVIVKEKNLEGWWKVEYNGKEGWTPGSYLQRLEVQEYRPSGGLGEEKTDVTMRKRTKSRGPPPRRESISRPQSIHGEKGKFGSKLNTSHAPPKPQPPPSSSKTTLSSLSSQPPPSPKPIVPPTPIVATRPNPSKPTRIKSSNRVSPSSNGTSIESASNNIKPPPKKPQPPSDVSVGVVNDLQAALSQRLISTTKDLSSNSNGRLDAQGKAALVPPPKPKSKVTPPKPTPPVSATIPTKSSTPTPPAKPQRPTISNNIPAVPKKPTIISNSKGVPVPPRKPSSPSSAPAKPLRAMKPTMSQPIAAVMKIRANTPGAKKSGDEYRVVQSFVSSDASSISIKKGEIVSVEEKGDNGWWFAVKQDGKEGWIPGDLLEKNTGKATSPPPTPAKPKGPQIPSKPRPPAKTLKPDEYYAIENYSASSDTELSLKIGDAVVVDDKTGGEWWFAKCNGKEGWTPSEFLSKSKL
eukprot:m.47770 g.47770  ORF g.47770 m.47770 type:complete len:729 (+) comp7358_c0_seq1:77-2263(+)